MGLPRLPECGSPPLPSRLQQGQLQPIPSCLDCDGSASALTQVSNSLGRQPENQVSKIAAQLSVKAPLRASQTHMESVSQPRSASCRLLAPGVLKLDHPADLPTCHESKNFLFCLLHPKLSLSHLDREQPCSCYTLPHANNH